MRLGHIQNSLNPTYNYKLDLNAVLKKLLNIETYLQFVIDRQLRF